MRNLVLTLLLLACSTIAGAASNPYLKEWGAACYWAPLVDARLGCGTHPAPEVYLIPDQFLDDFVGKGVNGLYLPGTSIVYVRKSLKPAHKSKIIVHEITHYIVSRNDKFRIQFSHCGSEEVSRMVADLYSGVPYTSEWKTWYNCSQTRKLF